MPLRAVLACAAALVGGLTAAVALAAPSPPGFAYGVAAGEMTSTSAKLWTRAPKAGPVALIVTARTRPTVATTPQPAKPAVAPTPQPTTVR